MASQAVKCEPGVLSVDVICAHGYLPIALLSALPLHLPDFGFVTANRPQCFRPDLSFVPDFGSGRIPTEAHVQTPVDSALQEWIKSTAETQLFPLCAPPGFGKTEGIRYAAEQADAVYLRASGASSLLYFLLSAYDERCAALHADHHAVHADELMQVPTSLKSSPYVI